MTSGASRVPELLTPRARALLPVFLVVLVALAVHQLWCTLPDRVVLSGPTMGTTFSVTLVTEGRGREDLTRARALIDERLAAVDALMSTWDEDSELSRFNHHASTDPFPLSPETLEVLDLAEDVSRRTGGAFDVTVRPLVAAWGFGSGARIPGEELDPAELAAIRERVGFELLELFPPEGLVRKRRPDVECDLSAIAKGFAVDEVARALEADGWTRFLVEVGGEVRARGQRPGGGPWRVGIERPDENGRAAQGVVALEDVSMATSGDYRSFYESRGQRLSHIVDPRSGRPVSHRLASVSVVHRDAVVADAWATALSVLGPVDGFELAESEELAAFFILRAGAGGYETRATRRFPPVETRGAAGEGAEAAAPDGPGTGS